ncbi:hypothetical protein EGR_04201 [Echinococcus granulosus]|uniref:Uncharacterized protein n=1 Tax=Echinococcus granulosus TaxID=6210 RepID=W6UHI1_ECHGR|nr:hypothetical protein EGR_04201 [Echinococcus granulosus]EUB60955.1 hypothetical protein EGR_04201 [Echinococcus granulosus]
MSKEYVTPLPEYQQLTFAATHETHVPPPLLDCFSKSVDFRLLTWLPLWNPKWKEMLGTADMTRRPCPSGSAKVDPSASMIPKRRDKRTVKVLHSLFSVAPGIPLGHPPEWTITSASVIEFAGN